MDTPKIILDVYVGWETSGTIQYDIHNHSDLSDDEVIRILSLSVPIIVNTGLGEMNFQQSLSLCNSLLAFLRTETIPTRTIELEFSGARLQCFKSNSVKFSYIPDLDYQERNEEINRGIKNLILNLTMSIFDIATPELRKMIKEFLLLTMHNFFLVVLPTVVKEDDHYSYSLKAFEIRLKADSFSQSLKYKLAKPKLLPVDEFNSLLAQTKSAYDGYKKSGTKPSELMDEYEKWEFTRDNLLPALENAILEERSDIESEQTTNPPPISVDADLSERLLSLGNYLRQSSFDPERPTASDSASEKQTMKYLFAHNVFPMICLGDGKETFRRLSGPKANNYLVGLWKALENKTGKMVEHNELHLFKEVNLGDNKKIFVINMPEPSLVPEAYLIGVAMKASKSLLSVEVKNVRYFTLELGRNYKSGHPEYHFCEWVGVVNPKHKNYGQLESPAPNIFVSRINDIF